MNKFDKEYYVMKVDGADNYPMLAWGETSSIPFIYITEINTNDLPKPIELVFNTPYPKKPTMPDMMYLRSTCVVSDKIKNIFEKLNIPKTQFIPVVIITNKKERIESGFYILHCWNGIAAIDKENYVGSPVDEDGEITILEKFQLCNKTLNNINLNDRLIFRLTETSSFIITHKSIKEVIENEQATGFGFSPIHKWNPSAIFEED